MLGETKWAMLASWTTHTAPHTHSVSFGNINVSSFIDDYSQQERGHLFNDSLSHPNTTIRQEGGNRGDILEKRKEIVEDKGHEEVKKNEVKREDK